MNNLSNKRLPTGRTVVVQFAVQLVDALSRVLRLKGSTATAIETTNSFNNGDVNVSADVPFIISGISPIVILSSLDPFSLTITDVNGNSISTTTNGLFINQGAFSKIEIKPVLSQQLRLQYIWS